MDIQWSLVLFTAIASCGTWVSVGVAVDELRGLTQRTNLVASVLALVLAVVGGIASVTHLSHPDRIMAVLSHPTAGIFLEALLLGLLTGTNFATCKIIRNLPASGSLLMICHASIFCKSL